MIPISDANYDNAWNLLQDHFSDKKDQVYAHLKCFMSFPAIHAENPASTLKLVDNVNEAIQLLEILDQKIEGFSDTTLHIFWFRNLILHVKFGENTSIKGTNYQKIVSS